MLITPWHCHPQAPVRWASAGTRTPHPITSNGRPSVIQNLAHRNAEFKKATLNDPGVRRRTRALAHRTPSHGLCTQVYPLLACLACGAALGVTQLVRYMRFGPDVKFDRRKRQAEIPYDEDEAVAWCVPGRGVCVW